MTSRVSLAELAAADIRIRPAEAVAIVSEICRQFRSGRITAVPSPGVIRLTSDGQVVVEGPITTGPGSVARAAHLLNDLLADVEAPAQYRASGGLRLVIARALGTLDLPPYASLEDFCAALARFAVPDLTAAAQTLYQAWASARAAREAAATAAPLTISDVRRARRATGLSLDDLAGVADVPVMRLRELEWGYMRHWRADAEGRDRVIRYARAAGLDERLVLSIAWPMIEDAALVHGSLEPEIVTTLVPSGTQALATLPFPSPAARARRPLRSGGLAAAAALVVAVTTLVFAPDAAPPWDARAEATPAPAESRDAPAVPAPMASPRTTAPPVAPVPAKTSARATGTARPAVRAVNRPAPAPQKRPSKLRSFFQRELFRIVIR
jgi:hypothetical protein